MGMVESLHTVPKCWKLKAISNTHPRSSSDYKTSDEDAARKVRLLRMLMVLVARSNDVDQHMSVNTFCELLILNNVIHL